MTPPANVNALFARALVSELARSGVRVAAVCPGSRSTPLALACAETPELSTVTILDERSAAFFALGAAKATGRPALVVCTSGTAGAHFYPAILEAEATGVPLVVVTADRPHELHGFGAPQTIDQQDLFGRHVRLFADLGVPEPTEGALAHLRALTARAVAKATGWPRGCVHLNAPFREPLAPTPAPLGALSGAVAEGGPSRFAAAAPALADAVVASAARELARRSRGVIVCGPRDEDDGLAQAAAALARATGYPVIADPSSQARFGLEGVVSHAHLVLRHGPFTDRHRPDAVIRLGGGLTSKALQGWLDASGAFALHVCETGEPRDPAHAATLVVHANATEACLALARAVDGVPDRNRDPSWATAFARADRLAEEALAGAFAAEAQLSEPRIAREVAACLPAGAQLVVASSMPVRDLDAYASRATPLRTLASRGANGIDGLVSTALGAAIGARQPTVLLTGDVALLHDLSGLVAAARLRASLTVVVVNNDGGGIFSFLPIAAFPDRFEELFGTPHGLELSHAAALVRATFHRPTGAASLRAALAIAVEGGLHLVEVRTSRATNVERHRELDEVVAAALGDGPWA